MCFGPWITMQMLMIDDELHNLNSVTVLASNLLIDEMMGDGLCEDVVVQSSCRRQDPGSPLFSLSSGTGSDIFAGVLFCACHCEAVSERNGES